MREKSRSKIDQQNIAKLNGTVQAYYMEKGAYPDRFMTALQTNGYTSSRLQSTPYGGYYQWGHDQAECRQSTSSSDSLMWHGRPAHVESKHGRPAH